MKAFILKNKILFSVLFVIGLLSFAGARYEIYRLSPGPKNGQIIGEKNGKWQATGFFDLLTRMVDPEDADYNYVLGSAYNPVTDAYEWGMVEIPNSGFMSPGAINMSIVSVDSTGKSGPLTFDYEYRLDTDWQRYFIWAMVPDDTTGIIALPCCYTDSTFRLVYSRADTLLKSQSIPTHYRIMYQDCWTMFQTQN